MHVIQRSFKVFGEREWRENLENGLRIFCSNLFPSTPLGAERRHGANVAGHLSGGMLWIRTDDDFAVTRSKDAESTNHGSCEKLFAMWHFVSIEHVHSKFPSKSKICDLVISCLEALNADTCYEEPAKPRISPKRHYNSCSGRSCVLTKYDELITRSHIKWLAFLAFSFRLINRCTMKGLDGSICAIDLHLPVIDLRVMWCGTWVPRL